MRRTTICRSKAFIAFALIAMGASVPARARQNPPSQPPPAGQQPAAAPAPATPLSAMPQTHTVAQGETLWSLAQQYFGDPLLWPEIYRLNTDVVEDPHWIFPGEELRLQAEAAPVAVTPQPGAPPTVVTVTPQGDTTRAAPPAPVQQPVPGTTIFSPQNRPSIAAGMSNLEVAAERAYRPVREGEYYSASFLTEGVDLSFGRLLGNLQSSSIRRVTTSSTAQLFTDVALELPRGDSARVGDLLLAVRRTGEIRGYGEVVKPTGLLRVTGSAPSGQVQARVVALYGAVTDGQFVMHVEPFRSPGAGRAIDVTDGITGQVVGLSTPGEIVNIQSAVFLNRGVQDGVRLGDVFQLSGSDRARNDFNGVVLDQAQALVVNARPHTCTAVIISMQRPDIRQGSTARQIRRLPT